MGLQIVERLGGSARCITLFTFSIHFLHSLFSVVNLLSWVRTPESKLTQSIATAYLAMTIVCCLFYFLGASVFYMWAWRFPEPEEVAKRRCLYGIAIHLLFCDLPLFVIETHIVWRRRFPAVTMGISYVITCISFTYSVLRVWFFIVTRLIKFSLPTAGPIGSSYPSRAIMATRRDVNTLDYTGDGAAGGGGVLSHSPAVDNAIFANRSAGLYSDGLYSDGRTGAAGLYHTPSAHGPISDLNYDPLNPYYAPSLDDLSTSQGPRQNGYRRSVAASLYSSRSSTLPLRI
ncbi:hypothetical protein LSCM1_00920 [Leishmania martiniquensis]|uniref:Uncharacterized protein n=1 Tax=Leishmania martiniquensis TaxID=1580590 RepID=A0A836K843_9TRYP|nr:hypothetical protein LSCM1_00920 [Leishmania martiniquensis]